MQIKNRISAFQEEMTSWRHHFPWTPELAYKEINTSKKVVELLKSFGIDNIEEGLGKTGIVATLENGKGKSIDLELTWMLYLYLKKIMIKNISLKQMENACLWTWWSYRNVAWSC